MPSEIPPLVPPGATFAPGQSPFRVKGVLYQGTQGFFEQNVQGGLATLVAEIEEPELRAFVSQKFLPSGWYDVLPVRALIVYEARALRMPLSEYLLHRTRYQAKRDLSGVYGWVLKLTSPAMVATRLPKIMSQMFDFARTEVVRADALRVETQLHDIPAVLGEWLHSAVSVYAETAMKLAGARSVEVTPPRATPTGAAHGVPLITLGLTIEWE